MARLTPFLMFQNGEAAEAARFYADLFPGSELGELTLYGPDEDGKPGTVKAGDVVVAGQRLRVFDSAIRHDFEFTPSLSFFVDLDEAGEVERIAAALAEGGTVLMPADHYPFAQRFAWVADRYGVSWQLQAA